MKKLITFVKLFVVLFIFSGSLFAQVTQDWVSRYNSSGNRIDIVSFMAIDGSGNVYVTGKTYTASYSYDEDFLTIKYNSSGVQQWVRTYDGLLDSAFDNVDKANAIAVDNSGNVYVTGSSMGNQYGDFDWVTIKYNSAGVEHWIQRYAPLGGGEPTSIVADESGFVYVSGGINNTSNGMLQFATIKYNSATGVPLWTTLEPFIGWKVFSMKVDISGNVYVTGPGWLGSTGYEYNYVTIKYNSSGVKQWSAFYSGPQNYGDDESSSIALDGFGNVYVTGSSEGINSDDDFLTIKYNSSGNQMWTARYDGPAGILDQAYSIAVDNSANVFVTGRSSGVGTGKDYATIKYNSLGVQQWLQRYNGPGNGDDWPRDLVLDASSNVYVTGSSEQWLGDYATIKYNSSGAQQWLQRYNGPGSSSDAAISVKVGASGKVYVTGVSVGIGTMQDYATIQYSQSIGIKQISELVPSSFSIQQNYPNPFNPTTKIKFDIVRVGIVKIIVYDAMGREVQTLVNESLKPGTYEVTFDGSQLTSGVYFYKIVADNFVETRKMMLLK